MTPDRIAAVLAGAGVRVAADAIEVVRRESRWLARLPGDRVAWFPADGAGAALLRQEARVLRLLAARCSFAAPRLLFEATEGWQLRTLVTGLCEPWQLFERTRCDRALARRIGRQIGAILAEQHAVSEEVTWLPGRPPWPEPPETVLPRLPADADLLRRMEGVINRYEAEHAASTDRVLVHGDLGFHNLAFDSTDDTIAGVFDYADASWSDRHQDFRYLVFPGEPVDQPVLDGALEVYEQGLGVRLDRARIRLGNAACAIGFLAHRHETPPDARPCGRTLAEDLTWVRDALAAL